MGDMRPKIQYLQLSLVFTTEGRGETPDAGHEGPNHPRRSGDPKTWRLPVSLVDTARRLIRSNRRGTDPYARWCGRGGAVRLPPIPMNQTLQLTAAAILVSRS